MAQSWTLLQKMTLWNDSWKSIISHFLISCEGHWPRALLQLLFMANKTSQPTFLLIYVKMNSHPFNLFIFFRNMKKKAINYPRKWVEENAMMTSTWNRPDKDMACCGAFKSGCKDFGFWMQHKSDPCLSTQHFPSKIKSLLLNVPCRASGPYQCSVSHYSNLAIIRMHRDVTWMETGTRRQMNEIYISALLYYHLLITKETWDSSFC